ncbi:dockerin type I domain-containing protein [Paenibacillus endoradicis]|uniref:dockerin type I domain-containing protein n=1 Tax=Paenibacillus endoradicis TaxID=2972487 RepID=UPI00215943DA|nr:dockerin type I domain-containing protein [Paenibacillus endoradicis]MCR8657273.1 dockerin type I domain-containing protein [Paenibacillus endoradicis]
MIIYSRLKRGIAVTLFLAILFTFASFPVSAEANSANYSIANDFMKYSINSKTGGFSIETVDGHPQKAFDNNLPLLYKEDAARSNGTSFTTVRIDGKDYIFGQEYGWFGIDTKLHEPVVSEQNRLLTVAWDIKGYTITQKVSISIDPNNPLVGNIGISYDVKNNNTKAGTVGIRLLLDNALGSEIDAPHVLVNRTQPTIVETEYSGENLPQQIRYVDSLSASDKMAYALLSGWSGNNDVNVDKVIVGHWVNLANTRYDYTPNPNVDFTNYSNKYLVPDTATAYYWSEKPIEPGKVRISEMLYGIGNFSDQTQEKNVSIGIQTDKVQLNKDKNGYLNDGKFKATVTIDNSVSGAKELIEPVVILTLDEGLTFAATNTREYTMKISGGLNVGTVFDIPNIEIIAKKQSMITAKRLIVSLNATEIIDSSTHKLVEYSANTNILIPAVEGELPKVSMKHIFPAAVYYEGDKNITVSGDMEVLEQAITGIDGWDLYLVSEASGGTTLIDKRKISFVEEGQALSFSTNENLAVGKYNIEFRFTNQQLIDAFSAKIISTTKLDVTNNLKDKSASYGIVSLVRITDSSNHRQLYDYISFENEDIMKKFISGDVTRNGIIHNDIKYEEDETEILLTVRGKVRLMGTGKERYYSASKADGDITINNILTYDSNNALKMTVNDNGAKLEGDGTIKVINSINIWHNKWFYEAQNGVKYSLDREAVSENEAKALELQFGDAGSMLQNIAGFLINIKYGVMTQDEDDFGISFGGKISMPLKAADENKNEEHYDYKGSLTAEISDILYGSKDEKIGFIGVNTTLAVALPEDILGPLVGNEVGAMAEVTINTIDGIYKLDYGISLTMLEVEGSLAFKEVPINDIPAVMLDELTFFIASKTSKVPIVAPYVFMTGLGGGIGNLAETVSGSPDGKLPPITLHLQTRLLINLVIVGDFKLEAKLSGLSIEGSGRLKKDEDGRLLNLQAGMNVQWISPFQLNAYGNISIHAGAVRGGITIKITEDYFYGYVYAGFYIPTSVPIIGGKEIGGIEAAVSSDFIGANIKVIGIKFGFIYYWDGDLNFGGSIDLSSRGGAVHYVHSEELDANGNLVPTTALYGTNMRRLTTMTIANTRAGNGITKEVIPASKDSLLFEIPLRGHVKPSTSEIIVTNPAGKRLTMVEDDNNGNGNYLVQSMDGKNYLYVTITDPALIVAGNWSVSVTTADVYIDNFEVNSVENIPELTGISASHSKNTSREINVSWTTDGQSAYSGAVNVYVTKDPSIMQTIESDNTQDTSSLISIGNLELDKIKSGSHVFTLPESFPEGNYYVVAMLVNNLGGMSKKITSSPFTFTNPLLPQRPKSVSAVYNGNGYVKAEITGSDKTATHYFVAIEDEHGVEVESSFGQFPVGSEIILKPLDEGNNPLLQAGKTYSIKAKAVRIVESPLNHTEYYSSTEVAASKSFVMPSVDKPKLVSVETNIDKSKERYYLRTNKLEAKYTFDRPVKMTLNINQEDKNTPEEFKTVWSFEETVEDGANLVDFIAIGENRDTIQGSRSSGAIGVTVDTSAPTLLLGEEIQPSLDKDKVENTVSNQVVFVSANSSYSFHGLTEVSASLTLDGSSEGIVKSSDGTFQVHRKTSSQEPSQTLLLKAVDEAGNETVVPIYLVNRELSEFESIKLISDLENSANQPDAIELGIGGKTVLSVKALRTIGETELREEDVVWHVLYNQNIIKLSQDGTIEALAPGETTIKVSYRLSAFEGENGEIVYKELSDVINISVKDLGYRYEVRQSQGFSLFTIYTEINMGKATVVIGGNQQTLLYDNLKKAYIGSSRELVSGEQLTANLVFEPTVKSPNLLRGDTNGSGAVDRTDVLATIEALLNNVYNGFSSSENWMRSDKNGDGIVDIVDAQLILMEALRR